MKKYFFMAWIVGAAIFALPVISGAEDETSGEILKKLNQVTQNQEKIMQSLEELKSELQIVKVRASDR